MNFEKACYSYLAMRECINAVKNTAWTVKRRTGHKAKCIEIKKLFEFCYDKTKCCLFEPEYTPCQTYLRDCYIKGISKKELDSELKACYRYLANELTEIRRIMEVGEVDTKE